MLHESPAPECAPLLSQSSETPHEESAVEVTYSYDEVYDACMSYFDGDTFAVTTWIDKYALRNSKNEILEKTPDDMHWRLVKELARIEAKYPSSLSEEDLYPYFRRFSKIVAQGSPMSGIGNPYKIQSLSNCFVIPSPFDSYAGILLTDQEQSQIMKRRGGVGFDISTIRPRGLPTANAAVTTDGIGVFMERYSHTCKEVAQGGRRGALMLSCDVHHPEILTFVRIKNELNKHGERVKVTNANVSVRLSDEFLDAVERDDTYELRWPVDSKDPQVSKMVRAREVWDEIISNAHASAEPGLLFWGNAKKNSPADIYTDEGFGSESTNPCGEIILSPYDSCRLMVVNLTTFVKDPFTSKSSFDWKEYGRTVRIAQRLMDDLVDLEIEQVDKILAKIEEDPEPDYVKAGEKRLWENIRVAAVNGRRTGLGITGLGDTVAMLNLTYGSDASLDLIEEIYKQLAVNSYTSSILLAKERGAFKVFSYEKEKDHPFVSRIISCLSPEMQEMYRKFGRRNIANTTTAPTGSLSTLAQSSSGFEPAFALRYLRRKKVKPDSPNVRIDSVDENGDSWMHFHILHHAFAKWCETTGRDLTEVLEKLGRKIPDLSDVQQSPYWGGMANDINWEKKVEAQGRAQKWVCHAISNTTNLPKGTPKEVVEKVYTAAWKHGCKGITVYVEGSRDGVLIREDSSPAEEEFNSHNAPKRPERLECDIHRCRVKTGDAYAEWIFFVGLLNDKPYEIFGGVYDTVEIPKKIQTGWIVKRSFKNGGKYDLWFGDEEDPSKVKDLVRVFDDPNQGVFTRIVSTALRHGTPVQYLVEQLGREKDSDMFTFAKGMARVLKHYIPDGTTASEKTCPECGTEGSMVYQEGCMSCTACGASKCG